MSKKSALGVLLFLAGLLALPVHAARAQEPPAVPASNLETNSDANSVWLPLVTRAAGSARITSPDGRVAVVARVSNSAERRGVLRFDVSYDGQAIITGGQLGIDGEGCAAGGGSPPLPQYEWLGSATRSARSTYTLAVGERSRVPDNFTELAVQVRRINGDAGRRLTLIVRAYDEGVALRYLFPSESGFGPVTICNNGGEKTQFRFASDYTIWQQQSPDNPSYSEGIYQRTSLSGIASQVETPLTMQHAGDFVVSIAEADVEDYPRAVLRRIEGDPPLLATAFYDNQLVTPVAGTLPFRTPWRVLMIAPSFERLLEQNYLLYNLSDPSRLSSSDWASPGTAMRVMDLSSAGVREAIDFAAAHHIEYVELDAGWYVPGDVDDTFESNPGADLERPIGALGNLPSLIDYARTREPEVGVILYANYTPLRRNVDQVLATYKEWGVAGIKLGFVRAYSQSELSFIYRVVEEAARPQSGNPGMFVNIHDDYRPSGLTRTYPNLFTQEGVLGNEHWPGSAHNTTLPVTRFLVGAADYTIPYYSQGGDPAGRTTRAHQLALSIVYFSPLKFVLWYDKPSSYKGEPEIDLFGRVPTVWDETRVLHARPGESVAIARRSGQEWYLGAITNGSARVLEIALDFLEPGITYHATIYRDQLANQVAVETQDVTSESLLTASMLASGGYALWLEPAGGQ